VSPVASPVGPGEPPLVPTLSTTPTSDRFPAAASVSVASDSIGMLATAVYVAGSTTLQAGHRYGIGIRESRLQILGPTEVQPERVAFDCRVAGLAARAIEGRLIVADGSGLVLAFMAVAGRSTGDLATMISEAGQKGGPG
jgi:hypothetical protein